jgi:hypothetical protein
VTCNCHPERNSGIRGFENRRLRRIFGPKRKEIREVGEV